jgi:hypothetical protein
LGAIQGLGGGCQAAAIYDLDKSTHGGQTVNGS